MPCLIVIADDLTGAMDTGLQFHKRGLETAVSTSWRHLPKAKVVVVNTDSRNARASEAHQRVELVASRASDHAIYKKIDSTMRGNVGFELRAIHDALRPRAIVVAPAFPKEGRTTVGGYQQVGGRPLHLTFFAHDPRWPMAQAHAPTLLMEQSGLEVGHVGLQVVAGGACSLRDALRARREPIVVVDAVVQSHLDSIATALIALGREWIPCGSAGLAESWANALGAQRRGPSLAFPSPGLGPIMVVSGSRNDATLAQLDLATEQSGVPRIDLDPQSCYDESREMERLTRACLRPLSQGHDLILTSSHTPLLAGGGDLVIRILAGTTERVATRARLGGLFLTGGDVAMAVCRALSVEALTIHQEIQPGIPGGQLDGGPLDGMWVVTKAGGFGDRRALADALAYLHGRMKSAKT